MNKINKLALACLSLFSITVSSASFAYPGNRPGALTFTLGGGYVYLDDKREMDNKAAGMIAVDYDLTEHWGVEGMLASLSTHYKDEVHDTRHVSGTIFALDGVYHFLTDNMFQPYVLAGVGLIGLSPGRFDANNSGNLNAAIGAQLFLNQTFSLRVEARDFYTWEGARNDVFLNAGVSATFDLC